MISELVSASALMVGTAMTPAGPWRVDTGVGLCEVRREFAARERRATLIIRKFLDHDALEVAVAGDRGLPFADAGTVAIIAPPAGPRTASYTATVAATGEGRLAVIRTDALLWEEIAVAQQIGLSTGAGLLTLRYGKAAGARAAIEACERAIRVAAGVPPDPISPSRRATIQANAGRFFGPSAYPRSAAKSRIQGRVTTVLTVDESGRVIDCRIAASANAALDAGTCDAARKVRFSPARDGRDRPVPSLVIMPVSWRLP